MWFQVTGFIFFLEVSPQKIGEIHDPIWRVHIFQMGGEKNTTN